MSSEKTPKETGQNLTECALTSEDGLTVSFAVCLPVKKATQPPLSCRSTARHSQSTRKSSGSAYLMTTMKAGVGKFASRHPLDAASEELPPCWSTGVCVSRNGLLVAARCLDLVLVRVGVRSSENVAPAPLRHLGQPLVPSGSQTAAGPPETSLAGVFGG